MIRQRGAAVGFTFNMDKRSRIYNTFDAHRLLHWAEVLDDEQGTTGENALALKHAFLKAYFTDGQDPSSHDVLVRYATDAGLDGEQAREVLASGRYARRGARARAVLPAARHPLGAGHHHRRQAPDLRAASRRRCSSRRCGRSPRIRRPEPVARPARGAAVYL